MKVIVFIVISFFAITVGAVEDSTDIITPPDSIYVIDSTFYDTLPDTLSEAQLKLLEFEKRQQQLNLLAQPDKEYLPRFSFYDSFAVIMLPPRLNLADERKRSLYRDAGHLTKFNPSYFMLPYQFTPQRTTVKPFGLSGDRFSVVYEGLSLRPFEHVIEPDGLIDFTDIPTATADNLYLLNGPVARIVGGNHSVATLLLRPNTPESYDTESSFKVHKGAYGTNYVRGHLSKRFRDKREIDLGVEYRSTDGMPFFPLGIANMEDSYQYSGRLYMPLSNEYAFTLTGQTYRRKADYLLEPDNSTTELKRNRIDRTLETSIVKYNATHSSTWEAGYRYGKNNSNIDGNYTGRFNIFDNGLFLRREFTPGTYVARAELAVTNRQFTDGLTDHDRLTGKGYVSLVKKTSSWNYAFTVGSEYMETYKILPYATLMLTKSGKNSLLYLSGGYSERAPSLYELHLADSTYLIYGTTRIYHEAGNPNLGSEKQLMVSAAGELGSATTNMRLAVTGGTILDGIEWHQIDNTTDDLFMPSNEDLTFTDINLSGKLKISDLFTFTGGGAYHWLEYETTEDLPYSPDFQYFVGGEMHVFWKQKQIHLYAYAEVVYTDEYYGYTGIALGNEPVVNGRLSFELKDFHFYYNFENMFDRPFRMREYQVMPGRYTSYGFTWNFLN